MPIAIAAAASVWAAFGPLEGRGGWRIWLPLSAAPLVAIALLAGVRIATKARTIGRRGDTILTVALAMLAAAHVLLLFDQTGLFVRLLPEDATDDVRSKARLTLVTCAAGAVFVLLGPLMMHLEQGNALGIRTKSSLASARAWTESHRLLGQGFIGAGVATIGLALYSPFAAFASLFVGPTIAFIAAGLHAKSVASNEGKVEQPNAEERPKENDSGASGV
ncbi:MAG: SdpI family protein [Deltaproteobacteria bacterium]|nr:SdpI family protein [Deltaproteobacteria bacterium]